MSGYWLASFDFGQLEARVIACCSLDKTLVDQIWSGYDIHGDWAKRFAEFYPPTLEACGGDLKKLRDKIKNKWVFPLFYGSSIGNASYHMDIPDDICRPMYSQFWDQYPGVKLWQERVTEFYKIHGYVQSMSGRRRHAPLAQTEIVNSSVQGDASDLVLNAENRLSELAQADNRPELFPRINIHDDVGFYLKDATLEADIAFIADTCVTPEYQWAKSVPLSIECKVGKDWYHQEFVGTFYTKQENLKYPF